MLRREFLPWILFLIWTSGPALSAAAAAPTRAEALKLLSDWDKRRSDQNQGEDEAMKFARDFALPADARLREPVRTVILELATDKKSVAVVNNLAFYLARSAEDDAATQSLAAEILRKIVAAHPKRQVARFNLAEVYVSQHDFLAAAASCKDLKQKMCAPLRNVAGGVAAIPEAALKKSLPKLSYAVIPDKQVAVRLATLEGKTYLIEDAQKAAFFQRVNAARKPQRIATRSGTYELGFGEAKLDDAVIYSEFLPPGTNESEVCDHDIGWTSRVGKFYDFNYGYDCPHWGGTYYSSGGAQHRSMEIESLFEAKGFLAAFAAASGTPKSPALDQLTALDDWAAIKTKTAEVYKVLLEADADEELMDSWRNVTFEFHLKSYDPKASRLCAVIAPRRGSLYNGVPELLDDVEVCGAPSVPFKAMLDAMGHGEALRL